MSKKHIIYILNFLLSFGIAIPAYINSSFLKEYTTEKFVGIIFTAGSLLTLIAFANIPKVLRFLGNFRIMIFLLLLNDI